MASLRMTLLDLLNKSEQGADPNFLRDAVRLARLLSAGQLRLVRIPEPDEEQLRLAALLNAQDQLALS